MQLEPDGAELFPGAFTAAGVTVLRNLLSAAAGDGPGTRLQPCAPLAPLLTLADAIARAARPRARAVFARYFDKNPAGNWALGWHQDRTIAVRQRREVAGFGQWTVKSGIHHCVPPAACLRRMLTLRIHLDDADADNAPLLVARGSHRLGVLAERDIDEAVKRCGTHACLARAGDVWLYAALILHASDVARVPDRRRVLQLSYSADVLPGGLEWLGV